MRREATNGFNGHSVRTDYTLDSKGRLASGRITLITETESPSGTTIFQWKGRTSLEKRFDPKGKPEEIESITYDTKGRIQERRVDDNADGTFDTYTRYRWDPQGRLREEARGRDPRRLRRILRYHYKGNNPRPLGVDVLDAKTRKVERAYLYSYVCGPDNLQEPEPDMPRRKIQK